MTTPDIALKSVNWTSGMLLTPEHFETQDRYVDSSVAWVLRYCVAGTGLVGGGVRLPETQRGLGRFDPKISVHDDGTTVRVAVLEARGLTPSGELVEVAEPDVVRGESRKEELAGLAELPIHVVCTGEREEDPGSVGADAVNPTAAALRRPRYAVALGLDAERAGRALLVGLLRRAGESTAFERDARFIPPCATLLGHSSLYAAWEQIRAEVTTLAGDFAELHRRAAAYAAQVARRGVDPASDHEVLAFVERAVAALDTCAYEVLDAEQSPERMLRQVDRAGRRAAIALDLSTTTRLYLEMLESADPSYGALLEEERHALARGRELALRGDLRPALDRAQATLRRLRRLCDALNAKYTDYRVNRALDGLRFLLDRDGEHFYAAVATPAHAQRDGDLLTFAFAQLGLAGRSEYRVVLLGDAHGAPAWQPGEELRVELRLNAASGSARPIARTVACDVAGQRNFAVNFDTPSDVAAITSLQVTAEPGHRIRGAVLFQRRLGLVDETPSRSFLAAAGEGLGPPAIRIRPTNPL